MSLFSKSISEEQYRKDVLPLQGKLRSDCEAELAKVCGLSLHACIWLMKEFMLKKGYEPSDEECVVQVWLDFISDPKFAKSSTFISSRNSKNLSSINNENPANEVILLPEDLDICTKDIRNWPTFDCPGWPGTDTERLLASRWPIQIVERSLEVMFYILRCYNFQKISYCAFVSPSCSYILSHPCKHGIGLPELLPKVRNLREFVGQLCLVFLKHQRCEMDKLYLQFPLSIEKNSASTPNRLNNNKSTANISSSANAETMPRRATSSQHGQYDPSQSNFIRASFMHEQVLNTTRLVSGTTLRRNQVTPLRPTPPSAPRIPEGNNLVSEERRADQAALAAQIEFSKKYGAGHVNLKPSEWIDRIPKIDPSHPCTIQQRANHVRAVGALTISQQDYMTSTMGNQPQKHAHDDHRKILSLPECFKSISIENLVQFYSTLGDKIKNHLGLLSISYVSWSHLENCSRRVKEERELIEKAKRMKNNTFIQGEEINLESKEYKKKIRNFNLDTKNYHDNNINTTGNGYSLNNSTTTNLGVSITDLRNNSPRAQTNQKGVVNRGLVEAIGSDDDDADDDNLGGFVRNKKNTNDLNKPVIGLNSDDSDSEENVVSFLKGIDEPSNVKKRMATDDKTINLKNHLDSSTNDGEHINKLDDLFHSEFKPSLRRSTPQRSSHNSHLIGGGDKILTVHDVKQVLTSWWAGELLALDKLFKSMRGNNADLNEDSVRTFVSTLSGDLITRHGLLGLPSGRKGIGIDHLIKRAVQYHRANLISQAWFKREEEKRRNEFVKSSRLKALGGKEVEPSSISDLSKPKTRFGYECALLELQEKFPHDLTLISMAKKADPSALRQAKMYLEARKLENKKSVSVSNQLRNEGNAPDKEVAALMLFLDDVQKENKSLKESSKTLTEANSRVVGSVLDPNLDVFYIQKDYESKKSVLEEKRRKLIYDEEDTHEVDKQLKKLHSEFGTLQNAGPIDKWLKKDFDNVEKEKHAINAITEKRRQFDSKIVEYARMFFTFNTPKGIVARDDWQRATGHHASLSAFANWAYAQLVSIFGTASVYLRYPPTPGWSKKSSRCTKVIKEGDASPFNNDEHDEEHRTALDWLNADDTEDMENKDDSVASIRQNKKQVAPSTLKKKIISVPPAPSLFKSTIISFIERQWTTFKDNRIVRCMRLLPKKKFFLPTSANSNSTTHSHARATDAHKRSTLIRGAPISRSFCVALRRVGFAANPSMNLTQDVNNINHHLSNRRKSKHDRRPKLMRSNAPSEAPNQLLTFGQDDQKTSNFLLKPSAPVVPWRRADAWHLRQQLFGCEDDVRECTFIPEIPAKEHVTYPSNKDELRTVDHAVVSYTDSKEYNTIGNYKKILGEVKKKLFLHEYLDAMNLILPLSSDVDSDDSTNAVLRGAGTASRIMTRETLFSRAEDLELVRVYFASKNGHKRVRAHAPRFLTDQQVLTVRESISQIRPESSIPSNILKMFLKPKMRPLTTNELSKPALPEGGDIPEYLLEEAFNLEEELHVHVHFQLKHLYALFKLLASSLTPSEEFKTLMCPSVLEPQVSTNCLALEEARLGQGAESRYSRTTEAILGLNKRFEPFDKHHLILSPTMRTPITRKRIALADAFEISREPRKCNCPLAHSANELKFPEAFGVGPKSRESWIKSAIDGVLKRLNKGIREKHRNWKAVNTPIADRFDKTASAVQALKNPTNTAVVSASSKKSKVSDILEKSAAEIKRFVYQMEKKAKLIRKEIISVELTRVLPPNVKDFLVDDSAMRSVMEALKAIGVQLQRSNDTEARVMNLFRVLDLCSMQVKQIIANYLRKGLASSAFSAVSVLKDEMKEVIKRSQQARLIEEASFLESFGGLISLSEDKKDANVNKGLQNDENDLLKANDRLNTASLFIKQAEIALDTGSIATAALAAAATIATVGSGATHEQILKQVAEATGKSDQSSPTSRSKAFDSFLTTKSLEKIELERKKRRETNEARKFETARYHDLKETHGLTNYALNSLKRLNKLAMEVEVGLGGVPVDDTGNKAAGADTIKARSRPSAASSKRFAAIHRAEGVLLECGVNWANQLESLESCIKFHIEKFGMKQNSPIFLNGSGKNIPHSALNTLNVLQEMVASSEDSHSLRAGSTSLRDIQKMLAESRQLDESKKKQLGNEILTDNQIISDISSLINADNSNNNYSPHRNLESSPSLVASQQQISNFQQHLPPESLLTAAAQLDALLGNSPSAAALNDKQIFQSPTGNYEDKWSKWDSSKARRFSLSDRMSNNVSDDKKMLNHHKYDDQNHASIHIDNNKQIQFEGQRAGSPAGMWLENLEKESLLSQRVTEVADQEKHFTVSPSVNKTFTTFQSPPAKADDWLSKLTDDIPKTGAFNSIVKDPDQHVQRSLTVVSNNNAPSNVIGHSTSTKQLHEDNSTWIAAMDTNARLGTENLNSLDLLDVLPPPTINIISDTKNQYQEKKPNENFRTKSSPSIKQKGSPESSSSVSPNQKSPSSAGYSDDSDFYNSPSKSPNFQAAVPQKGFASYQSPPKLSVRKITSVSSEDQDDSGMSGDGDPLQKLLDGLSGGQSTKSAKRESPSVKRSDVSNDMPLNTSPPKKRIDYLSSSNSDEDDVSKLLSDLSRPATIHPLSSFQNNIQKETLTNFRPTPSSSSSSQHVEKPLFSQYGGSSGLNKGATTSFAANLFIDSSSSNSNLYMNHSKSKQISYSDSDSTPPKKTNQASLFTQPKKNTDSSSDEEINAFMKWNIPKNNNYNKGSDEQTSGMFFGGRSSNTQAGNGKPAWMF